MEGGGAVSAGRLAAGGAALFALGAAVALIAVGVLIAGAGLFPRDGIGPPPPATLRAPTAEEYSELARAWEAQIAPQTAALNIGKGALIIGGAAFAVAVGGALIAAWRPRPRNPISHAGPARA